jgi:hypothetical protein
MVIQSRFDSPAKDTVNKPVSLSANGIHWTQAVVIAMLMRHIFGISIAGYTPRQTLRSSTQYDQEIAHYCRAW